MEFTIHGQTVKYNGGECGIYKLNAINSPDYAIMNKTFLVNAINQMPKDKAIEAVTQLKEQAFEQTKWESTPQNIGFPILKQTPGPTPISEVRKNIENTVKFTESILDTLKGK